MAETAPDAAPPTAPMPQALIVASRRWFSWAWMAPLGALALAAVLLLQASRERGVMLTVRFADGAGIRPGDALQFRGVQCGQVRDVELAPDLSAVLVRVELDRGSEGLAREGSRFWIVKPEVSVTRVRGLETLLGPRYLACAPGEGPPAQVFEGLERAPVDGGGAVGLTIVVEGARRGTISPESPVVYRGVRVGSVRGLELGADGRRVEIAVTIDAPFARFVRDNTRFWDAGGLGFDFGLMSGLSFQTGSLETVLAGGLAFATPTRFGAAVADGHRFNLEDRVDSSWLEWAPSIPADAPAASAAAEKK